MSPRWPLLSFPERMPMIAGGWRNSGEPQMNWKTLAATVLAINFLAMPAFADEHGELDHMQTRLQQMHGVYNQMQQAHSSAERHKLMAEHMQMMQDQMVDMQKAYAPGMIMRHQGSTNIGLESRMQMTQQRMDMLQQKIGRASCRERVCQYV